jgi:hypothetical protein
VLAGGLVVPLGVLAWLAARGGAGPFVDITAGYLAPLYSRVGRAAPHEALGWYRFGWATWGLLLGAAGLGLTAAVPGGRAPRRALAAVGVVYGALHFLLQGKGWEYHLYPLAAFAIALVPVALAAGAAAPGRGTMDPAGAPRDRGPRRRRAARAWVATAVWAGLVGLLGVKGVEALADPWATDKTRRVAAIVRDLRPLVRPGDTAQVLDTTAGGIHALLRLGVRQPTRFLYDFHFFHDTGDAAIQRLRAELVQGLAARPPAAVVVLEDDWIRPGYERLAELPEVADWLARGYDLAVHGDGYRIYAKRRGP